MRPSNARRTKRWRCATQLRREEPHGQYFKEEVRQQLVKQFGWERLSEGGLRVYTTIDPGDAACRGGERCQVAAADRSPPAQHAHAEPEPELRNRNPKPIARGRSGCDGPRDRRGPRDGRRTRLQGEPVQSRDAGAASAGLCVQAVRLRCGTRSRLLAVFTRDAARRADPDAAGRVDARRRALDGTGDDGAEPRCARRAIEPRSACSRRSASPRR